ncbi:MAG: hypothetical protein QOF02_1185, partial [Blastocatellia bacterium]|nr:hypothetical protein [Blastocatellia bacterium]
IIKQVCWLNRDGALFRRVRFPERDAPAVALHRADLQHILLHALPPNLVHLGKHFESYAQRGNEMQANFADGSSVNCDVLVGADGLHSRVREEAFQDGLPIYRGYTVWRGIAAFVPEQLEPLTAIELFGRGQRFGIGPVGQGRTGWWATRNESEAATEDASEHQAKLLKLFGDWHKPVVELIEGTPNAAILRNSSYDRMPIDNWSDGRMMLIGDAAHPTTPNLGQGGCMAIEDAATLARCLSHNATDTLRALRSFERLRHARTAALTRYSLRYGMVGQTENLFALRLRNSLLSLMPESLAQRLLRLIFDYDVERLRI